ncbi:MAG: alanine--tRNA ligase [Candidatus Marinimicrobia bacterium]|nr:alanine--tRNA ligase [Candidatus Neomarinimicrobiota bacterium]
MNSKELRQNFIDYFTKKKEHTFVRSSSVSPIDDPTLLFTNAGMNQFKDIFLGSIKPESTKVANSQKCIRVSGKHNDLEEVGVDNFHHTFFEMLGNWSFGDYYKSEAIKWAWEYLTEVLNLDKSRLWVTVYKDDLESENLWKELTDIKHERILRFAEKDNFWEMGDTGPCGPCTEIHYYMGDDANRQDPSGVNSEDLYREIWNLVFIQYNRSKDGSLIDLPVKHVDTGMGLERILSVVNNVNDHYETDLFKPIISEIERVSNKKIDTPHRVIADHLRMLSFSIADGVMPSNEGRGYVLRRVLRRASRYARMLNLKNPFIYNLVDILAEIMGDAYPELIEKKNHIKSVIKSEESSFLKTLDKGILIFNEIASNQEKNSKINGQDAFRLYDTYGFPIDLTILMAKEKNLSVDIDSFNQEMQQQKKRARESGKFILDHEEIEWKILADTTGSIFKGYETLELESKIIKYRQVDKHYEYILKETPFYAESGGQVGDNGKIFNDNYTLNISDTIKIGEDIVHISEEYNDNILKNNKVNCVVNSLDRNKIKCNHTATHLLQASLKTVLGDHVQQAGSLVDSQKLRFDLTHYNKISKDEIRRVENMVNKKIQQNIDLNVSIMDFDKAKESGAIAMFNEKYGDQVRVVDVKNFSKELCGGTHVSNTGEISLFKIKSESSLSTGVRRIEALTGLKALSYLNNLEDLIFELKNKMNCSNDEVFDKMSQLISNNKEKEKEITLLIKQNQEYIINELIDKSITYKKVKIIASMQNGIRDIKDFGSSIFDKFSENFIAVIGTIIKDKPMLVCVVSRKLQEIIGANEIIIPVAEIIDGGGGGKKSVSTAGGKDASKLQEAIDKSILIIKEMIDERF